MGPDLQRSEEMSWIKQRLGSGSYFFVFGSLEPPLRLLLAASRSRRPLRSAGFLNFYPALSPSLAHRGEKEGQGQPRASSLPSLEEASFRLGDVTAGGEDQESDPSGPSTILSLWERRLHRTKCATPYLFSCFNGGECVHQTFCDCRRFNATGPRCQTVYNTGPERDNICRTWGQHHVETFDGLYYYFSGRASYTLVGQYEPGEQSFSIQVHNSPECSSFPYSCPRSVSLFFAGEDEIRLSRNVTHGGLGVQLPHITGNLRLHQMAGYVIVQHQSVFTLAWDGESAVYIKMSPEYLGKTHGLCGNNNADPQDDLKTSFGKLTEDVAEFVNSWQEDPPDETPGPNVSFPSRPPCFHQSPTAMQGVYELCETLQKPPFDTCHDYVSPLPFMASCTSDLCLSASEDTTWCRALTEYARACAHAGRSLQGWRAKFPLCAVTCKEVAFIYNECINCCPVSCQPRTPCINSEIACVDGCYCPEGLIFEDGGCMEPAECPCEFHGSLYPTGSVVNDDCNTCTCRGGKWMCSASACPAECSVTGDIHFTTFDGRRYTFPATCQYILAKSRSSGTFTVTIQNAPCGPNQDGACIQSVTVILNQTPRKQVTLTQAGDVLMSGQYKVTLPYTDDAFEIRKLSSVFLRVRTSVGVQVLYDREGLRLYIQVDQRWKDDTVGLCGTFNGNMQDDFLSPVGVPESTPHLFGNSWKTLSACSPGISSAPLDPCDVHLQAASYAAEACSVLTKDLFAPCSPYLSPIPYYEQCRKDACRCGHMCMCSTLAHYTHLCRRHGVTIDFRTQLPDCALSCEATKEYSPCVATCGQTCQALAMQESCSDEEDHCIEGCACPPGTYLDSKAERCVPRSQCPCYFQGVDYPPGENNIPSLGHCHCIDGIMSCNSRATVSACPLGQVFVNCTDPHADLALSRERTCEHQLLNLTVPAQGPCVSGCTCPQGLVKHGDECFVPNECPCSWKGKEYFPGDMVNSSCHTCVCQHGSFQCTFHPCPATCTAYGDRHYRTFDGLPFDFVGTCKMHLVKSTSNFSFSVIMENVNCYNTGIICRKFISINVGNSLLIFDDETGTPSPVSFWDENQEIHMWRVGFFTLVHFPHEHITLLWDQRTTVHVQMGPQWQGMLAGLCGNFDLKTVNEMRTPENLELTNPQEFGSSWAAVECPDSSEPRDLCSLNPLREPFAKKKCSILLSEVFETCHPVVDVTWFYSNCLTDTCGCSRGGDCECLCTSLSAYAHQCCQHGIAIDWRSPRLCPYDCDYFNKALGKGPYQLVSYVPGGTRVTVRKASGAVVLALHGNVGLEDTINFLLTSSVYKPKAHDSDFVSFESADRPNYFLHVTTNGSLSLAKWERSEGFQNRATFIIHRSTWLPGYDALESFSEPGSFISLSGPVPILQRYQHTEQFRLATLLKLTDTRSPGTAYPACEWRYDACTSPCFQTCRDPQGASCQEVPRVEGCVPVCLFPMVLDEVTQKCVYLEDCIESATAMPSMRTPAPDQDLISPEESQTPEMSPAMAGPRAPTSISALTMATFSLAHVSARDTVVALTTTSSLQVATKEGAESRFGSTLEGTSQRSSKWPTIADLSTVVPADVQLPSRSPVTPPTPKTSSSSIFPPRMPALSVGTAPTKTTQAKMTFPGSLNTTKFLMLPTIPGFHLISKAVTVPTPSPSPVRTTQFQAVARPSLSMAVSERPPSTPVTTEISPVGLPPSAGLQEPLLMTLTTGEGNRTETPRVPLAEDMTSSSSSPPSVGKTSVGQIHVRTSVSTGPEVAQATGQAETGHTTATTLSTSPIRGQFSTTLIIHSPLGAVLSVTEATSSMTPISVTLVTSALSASRSPTTHSPAPIPFLVSESTVPSLLSDTSMPLAEAGIPLGTQDISHLLSTSSHPPPWTFVSSHPAQKGAGLSTLSPGKDTQLSVPLATSLSPLTFHSTLPPTSMVLTQVHTTRQDVPLTMVTALQGLTTPLLQSEVTPSSSTHEMLVQRASGAPGKSTTEKGAILSKQVPLPTTEYSTSSQGVTGLPAAPQSPETPRTKAKGSGATSMPHLSTSFPLGPLVSNVTGISSSSPTSVASYFSVSMGQTRAPGMTLGLRPPEESADEDTTGQPGRSAPAGGVSVLPTSVVMSMTESFTFPTCVPVIESECVRYICVEGELIRVNQTQQCPYSASPPPCGVLGFAVRANGDRCCSRWECACRCSIFPDLSLVTFDGSYVALFKEASYIVSQRPEEMVTVLVLDCKSANLGHLNWPPFCPVMLNVTNLAHQMTIDRLNRTVTLNSRPIWPPVSQHGFKIEDTGNMYVIRTPSQVQIQWFHSSGLMIVESRKADESVGGGLCGVCDGDVANDLTLPDGTVVEETEDPTPFLDSWQLPSTLTSVGQFRYREDSCATADCSPCIRMVSNGTFSSCHDFVTPESFCELWIRDTKYVQQPCVALTVYVAMCHKFNVCIEWRRSDYCPFLCPGDSTYQACVAVCDTPKTCQDGGREPPDPELCSMLGEGCVCPEGTVLHRLHSALCIPEEKCACTDSLGVPRAVGEIWNSSLSGCCQDQCVAPNTIIPVDLSCPETQPGGCQRFGEVALQLLTEDPCCLSTVCVCNQTLCEGLTPNCPPGDRLLMHYQEESCCPSYTCECDPEQCETKPDPQCRQDQMVIAGRLGDTCCLSYFCACDTCPDLIPTCQEGEVLTVDSDTAELCCPVYHCECQSFRCPQLQCDLGTSLVEVWSPDRCCPYRSCECDCDTIPVPKCHLWERQQLDMEFTQSAENVCDCVKYNCVKAPVCLSQERGVLQPGQKVVELSADGVCRTSHCTDVLDPLTNFYQINTTSVFCDVQCEENQEYQPPQDLATCCGSCKNVSCLFTFPNGTGIIFLPGASWISDCARHDCSHTALGVVLVVSPIICPPLNETECGKVGGSVVPSLEGCCKTCKEDGRSCKKVTVRMTIRKSDCRSNTPVNIVSCDGKCPSASIYNYNINTYARFCKCCREVGLQRRSVQLFCTGNASWVPYTIQEPTDCACQWF
ncbi:otogelin [Notamacropus eugenii]|uniref:otogelin n=1 Tax=Notamacropus eugenii TaxID=9315 RepID=UPI003B678691